MAKKKSKQKNDLFKKRVDRLPNVDVSINYTFIDTQSLFNNHFDQMMSLPYWVTDTETTGLDFLTDQVILTQIGNKNVQFLIDTREVDIQRLAEKLEDESFMKILQYAQFDYLMLKGSKGITMEGMRDTFIAEKLLTAGLQKFGFGMAEQSLNYLNIEIDKELQTSFINHTGPFTRQQKDYAALDCIYPDHIASYQAERLEEKGLLDIFKLECNAIPAFCDMEFYGMKLDVPKWEQNIVAEQKASQKALEIFMKEIAKHTGTDMFGNPDINPNSPKQILSLFEKLYPGEMVTRDGKPGTGVEILTKVCEKHDNPPEVRALLKIREHEKKVGTYGYTYINKIHEATGRFHPRIDQIGTDTGRPAGKKPNMLNIPAEARYRHPWIAGEGRKILTNDYGACELRIMASMSGDPVMCKGFNEGLDYHTYTASEFISDGNEFLRTFIPHPEGEPGKGSWGELILDSSGNKQANPNYKLSTPYERVTKAQRTVAKTINFGLAYGMGAKKLADTLKIDRSEAKEYVTQFNDTFKELVAWLKTNQDLAANEFYAKTLLGRKRYFRKPIIPREVEAKLSFKEEYRDNNRVWVGAMAGYDNKPIETILTYNPSDPWDENLPDRIKKYYSSIASIKREGGNSPIQGGNADITKIAMYKLRKWIRDYEKQFNKGEYVAHIALQVYDELLVDCPEELAEDFAQAMDQAMVQAGEMVITKVPVETGCLIEDSWVKG